MAYVEPKDLIQLKPRWQPWPLSERVEAALQVTGFPTNVRQSALAITLVEQPGKIPNGNCCGIMSQGAYKPWGWTKQVMAPVGYVMLKEGQTGKMSPFLAFSSPAESLWVLIERVCPRRILSGNAYASYKHTIAGNQYLGWVGLDPRDPKFGRSAKAFDVALAKVKKAWENSTGEFCEGWMDAGIGGKA